jgi:DNA replication and repair protein RecF
MRVLKLEVERFRNFDRRSFDFDLKTAVIGPNGAGKSNIVEALRLLSVGKSSKTNRLDEAIRFQEPYLRLKLERRDDQGDQRPQHLEYFYGTQFEQSLERDRQLSVDGQRTVWNEFWGQFPSVLFTPTDLETVLGPPQIRRKYLDSVIWQTDKEFRQSHLELSRVLRERAALLFLLKTRRASPAELQPWNELLEQLTEKVRSRRLAYVDFLQEELARQGPFGRGAAKLFISYKSNSTQPDQVFQEEMRLGQNLVGPQRDELDILFGDRSARRYASRGQARAAVLALKAAEAAYLSKEAAQPPLILLDDMFSELDEAAAAELLGRFDQANQIVSTCISPSPLIDGWAQIDLQ